MRRWMVYAAAVAAVLMLKPGNTKDIGGLVPVEVLHISKESGRIRAETDTGAIGYGRDLEDALEDLKETAPGKIFLETADYLIVTQRTAYLLPELTQVLRPAAEVCVGINAGAQAAKYLKAHPSPLTMKDIRAGEEEIPTLIQSKERYHFGETWKQRETA